MSASFYMKANANQLCNIELNTTKFELNNLQLTNNILYKQKLQPGQFLIFGQM